MIGNKEGVFSCGSNVHVRKFVTLLFMKKRRKLVMNPENPKVFGFWFWKCAMKKWVKCNLNPYTHFSGLFTRNHHYAI